MENKVKKQYARPPILVIIGPTASGKSALAVTLALRLRSRQAKKLYGIRGAEIVSADSRQIYTGLDIGTGKITEQEMKHIPHYCLDIASPQKQTTVALYQKCAERAIKKILAKNKLPIVVGGSGMYIDAVLYGAPYPHVPPNRALRARLEKKSATTLFTVLKRKDPRRARIIDRFNKRRLIRALEIIAATKKPIPPLVKIPRYNALFLGIKKSRAKLAKLIDARLEKRLRHGMVREVKRLIERGVSHARLWELGLEYRFVSLYLRGNLTKKELIRDLSRAIKHYAKRQETWFRQYPQTHWIKNDTEALRMCKKFLTNKKFRNNKPNSYH